MPREYRISWNKNQLSKLNSAVRTYNNAIRRAARKDPLGAQFLPPEVKYQDVKSSISTARQLNAAVSRLKRAGREGAMTFQRQRDGSLITKYEKHEYAVLRSVRERKKAAELRKKLTGTPGEFQFGGATFAGLTPDRRPIESLSAEAVKSFVKSQQKYLYEASFEKNERYVRNYIASLETEFGGFAEYDGIIAEVSAYLTGHVHDDEAIEHLIEGAPDIAFNYSALERMYRMEIIKEYWSGYVGRRVA